VARPAQRIEDVPRRPSTVELRYRYHRAQRQARIRRRDESRLARYRFYIALTVLLAISAAFVVGAWHEINHLFGL
jgi:hypothetical protein